MKLVEYGSYCHKKNRESMGRMCAIKKITYEITNNFSRLQQNDYDIAWLPEQYIPPTQFPAHVKIMYGPHIWHCSHGPLVGDIQSSWADRAVLNCLTDWNKQIYLEYAPSLIVPIQSFPFGISSSIPDGTQMEKTLDCVVYFKGRKLSDLQSVQQILTRRRLTYKIYSYGTYDNQDYINTLLRAKFCIWIGGHESQGFAFQECMATNTPLLVWGVTSMFDEIDQSNQQPTYRHLQGQKKLLATNLNCWNDSCGLVGYSAEEIDTLIPRMLSDKFSPRDYIYAHNSDEKCMDRILEYFGLKT